MNLPYGEFDSGPGYMTAMAPCLLCGLSFSFNPHTVISVPIDPQTNRPPDVGPDNERIIPEPEAIERAVKFPVCNECVRTRLNPALRERGEPEYPLARGK